jgi:hypothetical protein
MKAAVGIYYVLGYGRDCDGTDAFSCVAFVDKQTAEDYCEGQNDWSDGKRYYVTTDMRDVYSYCADYIRAIPFAYPEVDEVIKCSPTYI